ncbi:MAG: hypothetical protein QM811_01605 [Pirellulales bacterium]
MGFSTALRFVEVRGTHVVCLPAGEPGLEQFRRSPTTIVFQNPRHRVAVTT